MMSASVNHNHKLCFFAEEINDKTFNYLLTTKLVASKFTIAKQLPESGFRVRHFYP